MKFVTIACFRVAAILIGILYIKIYTSRIAPAELGLFFYLTTLSYVINAVILIPLDYYMQAWFARGDERTLPLPAIGSLIAKALVAVMMLDLTIAVPLFLADRVAAIDIPGLAIMAILLGGCTTGRNLLNNRRHQLFVVTMLTLETVGRILFFLLAWRIAGIGGRGLFYSGGGALAVELALIAVVIRRTCPVTTQDQPPPTRDVVATAAPIALSAGCSLIQLQSYRLLYTWAGIPGTAAILAVVANVGASGTAAAGQVFSQLFLPRIYRTDGRFTRTYIALAGVMIAFVGTVALIAARPLVALLTSPIYEAVAPLILAGVVVEGGNIIITAATVDMMLRRSTRWLLYCNILGALAATGGMFAALALAPGSPFAIAAVLICVQLLTTGGIAASAFRRRMNVTE